MTECSVNPRPGDQIQNDQKVPIAKCSGNPRSHDPTQNDQKVPKAKGVVAGKMSEARRDGQKSGRENCAPPGGSESLFKTLSLKFARGVRLARCTKPWLPPLDGGMPFPCGLHSAVPLGIPLACGMPARNTIGMLHPGTTCQWACGRRAVGVPLTCCTALRRVPFGKMALNTEHSL